VRESVKRMTERGRDQVPRDRPDDADGAARDGRRRLGLPRIGRRRAQPARTGDGTSLRLFAARIVPGRVPDRIARRDPEIERAYRLARYSADLTRLARRIAELRARGSQDGQHLRAAVTAYDQILLIAAAEFGHAADLHAPLSPIGRIALEADVTLAGLRWANVECAEIPRMP
jgi:hypothetical protein